MRLECLLQFAECQPHAGQDRSQRELLVVRDLLEGFVLVNPERDDLPLFLREGLQGPPHVMDRLPPQEVLIRFADGVGACGQFRDGQFRQ
jgi:hypothetical protein